MSLPHGGHLTHGSKVNFSGKWFDIVSYGVDEQTELIDYDEVRDLAVEHRPKMIICGATAYPRLIDFAAFRQIADEVGRSSWWMPPTSSAWLRAGPSRSGPLRPTSSRYTTHKVTVALAVGMIVQGGARQEDRQGRVPVHPGWTADARGGGEGRRAAEANSPRTRPTPVCRSSPTHRR